jgi:Predicted transcriptional regulator
MAKHPASNGQHVADDRILSLSQLLERIPLTRQSIWRMCRVGQFPAPIHLTKSRIGWRWSSVEAWIRERENTPPKRRAFFGKEVDE